MIKSDGTNTTSQQEVIDELNAFYTGLLCKDLQVHSISFEVILKGPLLSVEDCVKLTAPVDDASIKEALFNIGDEKVLGPDGYTAAFFKSCWDIIKEDFLQAVHEFFRNGKLLKQFNHAAIALIRKTKHVPEAKDFRPISYCNVVYKRISKVIAKRLAEVVLSIIDRAQNAFLEERLMNDSTMLAQQLI